MLDIMHGRGGEQPKEEVQPPSMICCLLVCKNGQFITRQLTEAPKTIILPLGIPGDIRLFLSAGEVVSPFVKVHFSQVAEANVSGFDMAIYEETSVDEFDPSGLEPLGIRSLDKVYDELNKGETV
jgi:hypothetical protein